VTAPQEILLVNKSTVSTHFEKKAFQRIEQYEMKDLAKRMGLREVNAKARGGIHSAIGTHLDL